MGLGRLEVPVAFLGRFRPTPERQPAGSKLDRFAGQIPAMLQENPKVVATVIARQLRQQGMRAR